MNLALALLLLAQVSDVPASTSATATAPDDKPKSVRELRQTKPFLPGVVVNVTPPEEEEKHPDPTATASRQPVLTETEQEMVDQLNAFRARSGLPALTPTLYLMNSARAQAARQAAANRMFHQSGIQENVAYGKTTVAATMQMWINSGGHNANMRTNNRECGVGVARSSQGTYYWCQVFASGTGGTASTTPPATSQPVADSPSNNNYYRRGFFRRR